MRLLAAFILLVAAASSWASVTADSLLIHFSRPVLEADIHVRADGREWSVLWNVTDSSNYHAAIVRRLGSGIADNIFDFSDELTISRVLSGKVAESYRHTVSHLNRESSVRLKVNGSDIRLYAGDGERILAPASLLSLSSEPSSVILRHDGSLRIHRIATDVVCRQSHDDKPLFSGLSQLHDYLSVSSDSIEGYWEYLDRDINAPAIQLGGFYRVAVVRHNDAYFMLYLGGADKHSSLWKPLDVKAVLRPTVFLNNFDVSWIDSRRSDILSVDVSASVTDGAILTLSFPLLKSSVRFRRKILKPSR